MSVAATRLRSARALVQAGWVQGEAFVLCGAGGVGRPVEVHRAYCAWGALRACNASEEFFQRAIDRISIPAWNDAYDRTKAQVLAAFDRAIALAEQETAQ